ncbi:helix-turn-helix domain-containing protein [uncultured Pontibacter sp.]|uniref:helix-turn-helix domain-containing protein n=1 Tax=uncultured Pontibacter sp. TaxID=453356 RepID=UPI0026149F4C|nr:helix-turn-helix domain-containing protein [uncultured Pontibacter sp.]
MTAKQHLPQNAANPGSTKQPAAKPGIKTFLTAESRYDKRLSSTAKIILSEIAGLAKKHNRCWATNAHFAKKFGVDPKTISRSITCLAKLGYIRVEINQEEGNKRSIFLCEDTPKTPRPMDKNDPSSGQNTPEDAASLLIYNKNIKSKDESEGNTHANFNSKVLSGSIAARQQPSWQEVELYMLTLGHGWLKGNEKAQATAFVDYYSATGWQMKSGPIQNWQAAARNWLNKSQTLSHNSKNQKNDSNTINKGNNRWMGFPGYHSTDRNKKYSGKL